VPTERKACRWNGSGPDDWWCECIIRTIGTLNAQRILADLVGCPVLLLAWALWRERERVGGGRERDVHATRGLLLIETGVGSDGRARV
jgi:hypothetical protein